MSTEDNLQALRAEIGKRRAELSALDRQREMARDELGRLETELAALDDLRPGDRPDGVGPGRAAPETPAEKVALFRLPSPFRICSGLAGVKLLDLRAAFSPRLPL